MLPCRSCSAVEARQIVMIPALNGQPGRALIAPIVVTLHVDPLSRSQSGVFKPATFAFTAPALLASALGFLREAKPKMISEQETSTPPFADESLHAANLMSRFQVRAANAAALLSSTTLLTHDKRVR